MNGHSAEGCKALFAPSQEGTASYMSLHCDFRSTELLSFSCKLSKSSCSQRCRPRPRPAAVDVHESFSRLSSSRAESAVGGDHE